MLFSLSQPVVYYLVKWCSLPYEDATWELKEDVDGAKVEEFRKIESRPARLKRTVRYWHAHPLHTILSAASSLLSVPGHQSIFTVVNY